MGGLGVVLVVSLFLGLVACSRQDYRGNRPGNGGLCFKILKGLCSSWVAQSVELVTAGCSSGQDLRACRSKPQVRMLLMVES